MSKRAAADVFKMGLLVEVVSRSRHTEAEVGHMGAVCSEVYDFKATKGADPCRCVDVTQADAPALRVRTKDLEEA